MTRLSLFVPDTDTIEQLCAQIENAVENFGVPTSTFSFSYYFLQTFLEDGFEAEIDDLIDCLLKAGIIVDREPPSDSISDNPITTQSNNPITTQSNNPITTQSNPINNITTQSNNPITIQSNNPINYSNQTIQ